MQQPTPESKKSTAVKKNMKKEIAELEAQGKKVKQNLVMLETVTDEKWNEMKENVNKSWNDLTDSYEKAREKYTK